MRLGGLFTGADGAKTEEEVALFGGTAGIPYDPNYHSPDDDLDNVDPKALGIMTRAIAFTTWSLAQDTSAIRAPCAHARRATTRCRVRAGPGRPARRNRMIPTTRTHWPLRSSRL